MLLQREQVKAPSLKSFSCRAKATLLCKMPHGAQQGPAWPGWSQAHLKSPNTEQWVMLGPERGHVPLPSRPCPHTAMADPALQAGTPLSPLSACQSPGEPQLSPQLSAKEGNLLFFAQCSQLARGAAPTEIDDDSAGSCTGPVRAHSGSSFFSIRNHHCLCCCCLSSTKLPSGLCNIPVSYKGMVLV